MDDRPGRALLIEDNPGDQRLIRELLAEGSSPPFDLACADGLAMGLKLLVGAGIDVVLLDLMLPDSTGLETFSRVHARASGVPIVVLTGLDDEALAVRAVQEGAQDYLVKGRLNSGLLLRSMRYAIERERLERAAREAEALRSVARLANAAAQEINDPLMVILGTLELLERRAAPDTASWGVPRALAAVERIREIIHRMMHITRFEVVNQPPTLPEMLDLRKSSDDPRDEGQTR